MILDLVLRSRLLESYSIGSSGGQSTAGDSCWTALISKESDRVYFALVLLRSARWLAVLTCKTVLKRGPDMDSLMTEDEWETLRLDSTDGGLSFHTLMIRPLCVCVCVCVCGLIWPQSVY